MVTIPKLLEIMEITRIGAGRAYHASYARLDHSHYTLSLGPIIDLLDGNGNDKKSEKKGILDFPSYYY